MEALIFEKKDITKAANWLLKSVKNGQKIAFYGEMGAGKTTFIGALCKALGVKTPTASPTFSLVNQYVFLGENGARGIIHHLDLYRLKNLGEAIDIGIEEILEDENWALVEWPQLIEPIFPKNMTKILLETVGEKQRRLTILN